MVNLRLILIHKILLADHTSVLVFGRAVRCGGLKRISKRWKLGKVLCGTKIRWDPWLEYFNIFLTLFFAFRIQLTEAKINLVLPKKQVRSSFFFFFLDGTVKLRIGLIGLTSIFIRFKLLGGGLVNQYMCHCIWKWKCSMGAFSSLLVSLSVETEIYEWMCEYSQFWKKKIF